MSSHAEMHTQSPLKWADSAPVVLRRAAAVPDTFADAHAKAMVNARPTHYVPPSSWANRSTRQMISAK